MQGQRGKTELETSPRKPLTRTNSLEELRRKRRHADSCPPSDPRPDPTKYTRTLDEGINLREALAKIQRDSYMDGQDGRGMGYLEWPSYIGWDRQEWNFPVRRFLSEGFPTSSTEMVPVHSLIDEQRTRGRRKEILYRTPTVPPRNQEWMGCLRSTSVESMPCRRGRPWQSSRAPMPEGITAMQPSTVPAIHPYPFAHRRYDKDPRSVKVDRPKYRSPTTDHQIKKGYPLRVLQRPESSGRTTFADLVHAQFVRTGHQKWTVGHDANIAVTVKPEGSILYKGVEYHSISSFALAVIRERNPDRRSCDGWKDVKCEGQRLEAIRERYLDLTSRS